MPSGQLLFDNIEPLQVVFNDPKVVESSNIIVVADTINEYVDTILPAYGDISNIEQATEQKMGNCIARASLVCAAIAHNQMGLWPHLIVTQNHGFAIATRDSYGTAVTLENGHDPRKKRPHTYIDYDYFPLIGFVTPINAALRVNARKQQGHNTMSTLWCAKYDGLEFLVSDRPEKTGNKDAEADEGFCYKQYDILSGQVALAFIARINNPNHRLDDPEMRKHMRIASATLTQSKP
jgi:hypothetical protein